MASPILPPELQKELDDAARKYSICIHTQQYPEALSIITNLSDKMLDWQEKYGQRFHKGYPIHNTGFTLYLQNKPQEAIKYFILAYIEDLLSADRLEEADVTPAGSTLIQGYRLSPELLKPLKQTVTGLKKQDKIPRLPEEVLQELEKSMPSYEKNIEDKTVKPKEYPRRKFTIFDSEWERRVFIGGSGDATINYMRDTVEKLSLGHDPVVAVDFDMPEGMTIYHKCITLLHCCKYAIFDLSTQGGQLIEIERAPDYRVKTMVVWQTDREQSITEVLKSCLKVRGIEYKSYTKFAELEGIFREFLEE